MRDKVILRPQRLAFIEGGGVVLELKIEDAERVVAGVEPVRGNFVGAVRGNIISMRLPKSEHRFLSGPTRSVVWYCGNDLAAFAWAVREAKQAAEFFGAPS